MELIISLRKYGKLEYVMNNYCIFVTESIISNLLIYGDKVASFLYQKKVTCALLPTTDKLVYHQLLPKYTTNYYYTGSDQY